MGDVVYRTFMAGLRTMLPAIEGSSRLPLQPTVFRASYRSQLNQFYIMKKQTFLASTLLLVTAVAQAKDEKRPNIVFIMADDLGYSELGCYGNKFNETPVLDRMAAEGVRFTHAHTAASLSSPTRAALMTGQYPYRTGIVDYLRGNSDPMRTDLTTIAEALRDNGYHTGIIGKWHLTGYLASGAKSQVFPSERGFSEMIISENKYIGNGSYFHPYHFNESVAKLLPEEKEFLVDRMNHEATEFIRRNRARPFFLYLSHYAVHNGLMGTPETVDHFRAKPGAGISAPSENNPENDPYKKFPADYRGKPNNPHLAAQLKHIDTGVGEILQALRDNGLMENTLVVFTSDNGGATGVTTNAPLRGGKTSMYEGGTLVPMIFYGYATEAAPKVIDQRFITMDFFPTFCELTQTERPDQLCDGISILPLLNSEKIEERDFFWYFPPSVKASDNSRNIEASVISGNHKLIERYTYDGYNLSVTQQELYDLSTDPYEKNDLSRMKPETTRTLNRKLKEWRRKIKDGENPPAGEVIHVSPQGAGSGESWEDSASLEQAVAAAHANSNQEIWMKAGTYELSSTILFDHLFIFGGFEGNETRLEERNWDKNQVIIDGKDQFSPFRNTTGAARPGGRDAYIPCIIDGFTVQNAVNPLEENGGAMILSNGAFVRNCIFRNNATRNVRNGAAIHCNSGLCVIENSLFVNNSSAGNGGAIQVGAGATATIRNCTFANNSAARPGGAVGTATNKSNVMLINSILYNNRYGEEYNSYGQNATADGGGTVISMHSAIESSSTKFTDGDDVNHFSLSRNGISLFSSPSAVIGKGSNPTENDAIYAATYTLTSGSPCIDAGLDYEALDILLDLQHQERIQGKAVDMGAYESTTATGITEPADTDNRIKIFVVENELYIRGADKGETLFLYNLQGMPLDAITVEDDRNDTILQLKKRGIYIATIGGQSVIVRF